MSIEAEASRNDYIIFDLIRLRRLCPGSLGVCHRVFPLPTMSNPPNFYEVTSAENFKELLSNDLQRVSLINFWASLAEPCETMNEVVLELAKKYPQVLVLQVEAEAQQDIAESFEVEAVPAFFILRGHTLLKRINGADAPALTEALAKHSKPAQPVSAPPSGTTAHQPAPLAAEDDKKEETPAELEQRLRGLMSQSKSVLFMKGSPDAPRCGFSKRIVALLREKQVEFTHFDILQDDSVRQGLKTLNNWPTFPQFIVDGELVGGLDVVTELADSGELEEMLKAKSG